MAACVLKFLLCEFHEVIWEVAPLADPASSQACSTGCIRDLNGQRGSLAQARSRNEAARLHAWRSRDSRPLQQLGAARTCWTELSLRG